MGIDVPAAPAAIAAGAVAGADRAAAVNADAPARWRDLRRFTPARVALGRAGNGLPTAAHLAFQAAHARRATRCTRALDAPALLADAGRGAASTRRRCAAPPGPADLPAPARISAAGCDEADRAALPPRPPPARLAFVLVRRAVAGCRAAPCDAAARRASCPLPGQSWSSPVVVADPGARGARRRDRRGSGRGRGAWC